MGNQPLVISLQFCQVHKKVLLEWEKFDPARRNFFDIAVISENGTWPHMENGYHNKDVDYWLINMTQFDASLNTVNR